MCKIFQQYPWIPLVHTWRIPKPQKQRKLLHKLVIDGLGYVAGVWRKVLEKNLIHPYTFPSASMCSLIHCLLPSAAICMYITIYIYVRDIIISFSKCTAHYPLCVFYTWHISFYWLYLIDVEHWWFCGLLNALWLFPRLLSSWFLQRRSSAPAHFMKAQMARGKRNEVKQTLKRLRCSQESTIGHELPHLCFCSEVFLGFSEWFCQAILGAGLVNAMLSWNILCCNNVCFLVK